MSARQLQGSIASLPLDVLLKRASAVYCVRVPEGLQIGYYDRAFRDGDVELYYSIGSNRALFTGSDDTLSRLQDRG